MNGASPTNETEFDTWIPDIYLKKVRAQRTRSYEMDVPERENQAEILFTLLGIEVQVGKKRFACPDLATARYLSVFARIGCRVVAIPYDITRISLLADELEVALQRIILVHTESAAKLSPQTRGKSRAALIRRMRAEITAHGAGDAIPSFKNSTRQRES